MRSTNVVIVLGWLSSLASAHTQGEAINTQQPFVGWTQEDLDAKWGTDVQPDALKMT